MKKPRKPLIKSEVKNLKKEPKINIQKLELKKRVCDSKRTLKASVDSFGPDEVDI